MGTSDTQTLTNKTLSDNVKAGTNFIITPSPTATTSWKGANLITVPSQLPMQRAKLKVYPVTVVNLLGKYGDFENDADADGYADGWSREYWYVNAELSTEKVVIGSKSQHLWIEAGGDITKRGQIRYDYQFTQNNVYFVSVWMYSNSNLETYNIIMAGTPASQRVVLQGNKTINQFNKHYTSFTVANTGTAFLFEYCTATPTVRFDFWLDGAMIVDLTRMGVLPPPLKEYFNNVPSTWADLATASNITAIDGKVQSGNAWLNELLPYVNGVATLGYAWGA